MQQGDAPIELFLYRRRARRGEMHGPQTSAMPAMIVLLRFLMRGCRNERRRHGE
jgi:hypothetical protein